MALSAASLGPNSASALPDEQDEKQAVQLQTLYKLGRSACERGEYESCYRLFMELDERVSRLPHKFYLAQALVGMGRMLEGVALWQELVNSSAEGDRDADIVESFQRAARERLAEVQPDVPRLELEVASPHTPTELVVRLDGRLLSVDEKRAAVALDPGTHRIELAQPGFVTERRELQLHRGELERVTVALAPLQPVVIAVPPSATPTPARSLAPPSTLEDAGSAGGEWMLPAGITLTVLGVAGMVGGAVSWSLKEDSKAELYSDCGNVGPGQPCEGLTRDAYEARNARIDTRTTISNTLLFGGGGLMAAGLTFGLLHLTSESDPSDKQNAMALSGGMSADGGWLAYLGRF